MGVALVLCFSIGLALTMVGVGAAAALSVNRVSKTWGGFEIIVQKAPYLSGALITLVGIYTAYLGYIGLGL
jgi:nickel/cobalt exporter